MNSLQQFMKEHRHNGWIEFGPYEIYLRHAFHNVNGETIRTFDVANIVNKVESSRGRGGFALLLEVIEELLSYEEFRHDSDAIYVEMLNQGLAELMPSLHYDRVESQFPGPPSFIRHLSHQQSTHDPKRFEALNRKMLAIESMK